MPLVLSSERRTFVVFDQDEGSTPLSVGAIEFAGCVALTSGFPNDEVLRGHRLWNRGLEFYKVHEVIDSSWLAEMQAIEHHHDQSADLPFKGVRHYVLTFHDSTIEALATALIVVGTYPSSTDAVVDLTGQLGV